MKFLNQAENVRAVKGSDRVLRCEATGEEYPIATIASGLAEKFDLKPRAVTLKLNHAIRNDKTAFGLKWSLVSGTPYAEPVKRGPRAVKEGETTKKKRRAA